MPYPWYIAWFRSPVTVLGAAEGPAMVATAFWFVALIFTGPSAAVLWPITHLFLAAYTRRVQRRLGCRPPTPRESAQHHPIRGVIVGEWRRLREQDTKGDQ